MIIWSSITKYPGLIKTTTLKIAWAIKSSIFIVQKLALHKNGVEQAGADLGQAQVKLEVIVEVGVEDRCIYLIPSEF